jgi:alpha-glucosidase
MIAKHIMIFIACLSSAVTGAHAAQAPTPNARNPVTSAASEHDWWKNAVIYEVYPRSFQDTNGDGIGDLNGITEHLDYLEELGVDAIWLTPAYPSPNADFGYDVSDYQNINPEHGTLADFDRLVAEARKRNIRVIMDMVMNHTSDQHPWFLASRSSRDNRYRDWYVWKDGKGETADSRGGPPNNWGGYNHPDWEWDEKTRQYYFHHFSVHQPDLNWYNPAIEKQFFDITSFWLKRGVAGFRFDAIGTLFEDPSYADEDTVKDKNGQPVLDAKGNPVLERKKSGMQPAVHTVMQQMRAHIDAFDTETFPGTRVLIGETSTRSTKDLLTWYGATDKPEFELPMDMQVGFINSMDVSAFRQRLTEAETEIGDHVPLLLFDNHDRPRFDARYGDGVHDVAIQCALATVLFASGGAAQMYYGDEIGMKTTPPTRIEDVKDTMEGLANWPTNKGRDGERTPMQWDANKNAGFTTGIPWLPVPPSASTVNVRAEEGDPDSLLAWYRELIHLKKSNGALARGANTMLDKENTKVLSWIREAPGESTVVISVNFTAEPQTVHLAAEMGNKTKAVQTLLKSHGSQDPASLDQIELGPFGVFIGAVE